MRFLADECIYQVTIEFLRALGQDVIRVEELGLQGADDDVVISKAIELGRVLLTRDLDFANIINYPPASHLGVVILRMDYLTFQAVHRVLEAFLKTAPEMVSALAIIDRNKFRIRRK